LSKNFEEVNGPIIFCFERQPTKRRLNVSSSTISKFFAIKNPFKNDDEQQKDFFTQLGLSNCEKSRIIVICGKSLAFYFIFASSNCLPFQKIVFS
jgi:hypothetical protein